MFAFKKKYFLLIESIKDINLRNLKKYNKVTIIYRNNKTKENFNQLLRFRKQCKLKLADFYVANDTKLAVSLNADGIYLSSYNTTLTSLHLRRKKFNIIGSAHNANEISYKIRQGCVLVLVSKLFLVDYDKNSPSLGIIKFSKLKNTIFKKIIPLGGIKINNLNYLNHISCDGFAVMTGIKKKPTITSRLF
jgi:thiamine monophosphate synthase